MIVVSYLTRARRLLWAAPVTWEKTVDRWPEQVRIEVSRALSHIAQQAARASEYVDARASGGTHADGVKHSNRRVRRVRRALGYTYPRGADLNF